MSDAAAGQHDGLLQPGVSYFQVLIPSMVKAPNGDAQYAMHGPFLDFSQAAQYCAEHPGSLLQVSLVQWRSPSKLVAANGAAATYQPIVPLKK